MNTKGPNHVLVVDDELFNRELLEGLLIPLGYEVTLAVDGKDALEKIKKKYQD